MANGLTTGGGSRKGVPNKMGAQVKAMILAALDEAGGVNYLVEQARTSPSAFLGLLGRILPIEQATLGANGQPVDPGGVVWVVEKVRRE